MKTATEYIVAIQAVDQIIDDLRGRRGLRHEWDQIDEEIRAEIRDRWIEIASDAEAPQGPPGVLDMVGVSVALPGAVRDLAVAMARVRGVTLDDLVTAAILDHLDPDGKRRGPGR